jgi:heme-degrading monooxygenase HmoA
MTFREESVNDFKTLFDERKDTIKSFTGCTHLELWQDVRHPNVFFTYSHWESEVDLDHYRFSEFFKDTWSRTKALFQDKPQAWSVNKKA